MTVDLSLFKRDTQPCMANTGKTGPGKLYIKVTAKKSKKHKSANHLMIGQLAIYSHVFAPNTEKGKIFTHIFFYCEPTRDFLLIILAVTFLKINYSLESCLAVTPIRSFPGPTKA